MPTHPPILRPPLSCLPSHQKKLIAELFETEMSEYWKLEMKITMARPWDLKKFPKVILKVSDKSKNSKVSK